MFEEDLEELEDGFEDEEIENGFDAEEFGDDIHPHRARELKDRLGETPEDDTEY